jgi:probable F420-dependent oxidoreductase
MPIRLGRVGIWSRELRFHEDRPEAADAARELERLGYGAAWIPDVGGTVIEACDELLRATRSIAVATGIINIWMHEAETVARGRAALERDHPGRFTLGLGASHAPVVDADGPGRYRRPYSAMRAYLDALDRARPPVAAPERILAALGPRMTTLARDRAAGAHPYLVTVEQTAAARAVLGSGRILAPELSVVLEVDRDRGLAAAREHLAGYLTLPNYTANFRRAGFDDADLSGGGSERLVDALVAIGDEGAIARRVGEHLAAGADHVCIQVVHPSGDRYLPRAEWRRLAPVLLAL